MPGWPVFALAGRQAGRPVNRFSVSRRDPGPFGAGRAALPRSNLSAESAANVDRFGERQARVRNGAGRRGSLESRWLS